MCCSGPEHGTLHVLGMNMFAPILQRMAVWTCRSGPGHMVLSRVIRIVLVCHRGRGIIRDIFFVLGCFFINNIYKRSMKSSPYIVYLLHL